MTDIKALDAAATQGVWDIWREPVDTPAAAIEELAQQVMATDPMARHLVLLNADGKCPAITGCGPTSEANAAFIVALVNAYRSGELVPRAKLADDAGAVERGLEAIRWLADEANDAERAHVIAHLEVTGRAAMFRAALSAMGEG